MKRELQLLEKILEKAEGNILLMQEPLMLKLATIQQRNQAMVTNKPGSSKISMNTINSLEAMDRLAVNRNLVIVALFRLICKARTCLPS